MERKENKINVVSMENIDKIFPKTDFIDKAIIHAILNSNKSHSHNTLFKRFQKNINFFDRLDRLVKDYPSYLKRWEEEKPTLQVGSKQAFEDYQKSYNDKGGKRT